jgi:hypothetical protein
VRSQANDSANQFRSSDSGGVAEYCEVSCPIPRRGHERAHSSGIHLEGSL